ncbi:MAG TPA: hypothetical protein VF590_10775, partial [Isosphaeraceae bacterium]
MHVVPRSGIARVVFAGIAVAALIAPRACPAQTPSDAPDRPKRAALSELEQAVIEMMKSGRPVVVAFTADAEPTSRLAWQQFRAMPAAAGLLGSATFLEVVVESNRERARKLRVQTVPTVVIYTRGRGGPELAAYQAGFREGYSILGWLMGQDVLAAQAPPPSPSSIPAPLQELTTGADAEVSRAGYEGSYPSPQATPQVPQYSPPPPPQQAPPQPQQAPPQPQMGYPSPPQMSYPTQPQMAIPVVNAQSQPAMGVAMPSQSVFVQPTSPTVVVGAAPPPNVVFTNAMPSMPSVSMALPPAMSSPPQMMMGMPSPPSAPPAQPMMSVPQPQPQPQPQPMMGFPQPQPMMGMTQPMQGAAQPQQGLATAAAVGLILNNPGLIDRLLGALGRLLSQRGQPRIQMNPATPQTFQGGVPLAQAGVVSVPQALLQT